MAGALLRAVAAGGVVSGGFAPLLCADRRGRAWRMTSTGHDLDIGYLEAAHLGCVRVLRRRLGRLPLSGKFHFAAGIVLQIVGAKHFNARAVIHIS